MLSNQPQLLIGLSITAFLALSVFAMGSYKGWWFLNEFDTEISKIVDCTSKENATTCSGSAVKKLLDLKSGADVMTALSLRLTPPRCHYIGHIVGQQSLDKYRNVEDAMSQCSRTCDSACMHGIIGQAFAVELGLGADNGQKFDLQHLSQDDIRKVGRRLCQSPEACHGVGHTVFQIFKEMPPSISVCKEIAPGSMMAYCYNGVFMEYADILTEVNFRPITGVEYPKLETLDSFCDYFTSLDAIRACFRYFPRIVAETFEKYGYQRDAADNRTREICESFVQEDRRIACIAGVGVNNAYSVLTDHVAAIAACEKFSSLQDKASCYLGEVGVATGDRRKILIQYCGTISRVQFQAACYQEVFFFIGKLGFLTERDVELCENNSVCKKGFENHKLDSWELVKNNFD